MERPLPSLHILLAVDDVDAVSETVDVVSEIAAVYAVYAVVGFSATVTGNPLYAVGLGSIHFYVIYKETLACRKHETSFSG